MSDGKAANGAPGLDWRVELPQWLLLAGMYGAAAFTWPGAPQRIPVHWNLAGEVDRYGGRFEGLLLLPFIATAVYLMLAFLPRLDPGRANYASFTTGYALLRLGTLLVLASVYAVVHLWIRGHRFDVGSIALGAMGGLFLLIGNMMGKVRPNFFVGIRTPWTLSSARSWSKTHRAGGWAFIAQGLLLLAAAAWRPLFPAAIGLVIGGSIGLVIYSYMVWRNDPDKVPPAGRLPA